MTVLAFRTGQPLKDLIDLDPIWLTTLAEVVRVADEEQAKANRGR